jgi:hypothetical protein
VSHTAFEHFRPHPEALELLANPPFGKNSSTMFVGEDGKTSTEKAIVERDDFWATTSNKQLNFVQHTKDAAQGP